MIKRVNVCFLGSSSFLALKELPLSMQLYHLSERNGQISGKLAGISE